MLSARLLYLFSTLLLVSSTELPRAPLDVSCEVRGWDGNTTAYNGYNGVITASLTVCAAQCLESPTCKSFAFGRRRCYLYTKTVQENCDTDADSPYVFYDRECAIPAPSTASPAPSPTATRPPPPPNPPTYTPSPTPLTTTTERPTTTSTSAPAPTGQVCGVAGYDKDLPSAFDSRYKTTLAACYTLCKSTTTCASFSFGRRRCVLYAGPVAGNLDADTSSPYKFYDLSCVITSTSTPAGTPSVTVPGPGSVVTSVITVTSTSVMTSTTVLTTSIPRPSRTSTATTPSATPSATAPGPGSVITSVVTVTSTSVVTSTTVLTSSIPRTTRTSITTTSTTTPSVTAPRPSSTVTSVVTVTSTSVVTDTTFLTSSVRTTRTSSATTPAPPPSTTSSVPRPPQTTTVPRPPPSSLSTSTSTSITTTSRPAPPLLSTSSSGPPPSTVTTISIPPSTVTTISSPPPSSPSPVGSLLCNVNGWSKGNTTFYDSSGSYANQTACAAACRRINCGSYGVGSGTCLTFSAGVAQSITQDPSSGYKYWDAACPIVAALRATGVGL